MQQQHFRPHLCYLNQVQNSISLVFLLKIVILSLLAASVQGDDYLKEAPTFLTPCSLGDPKNGECLAHALENVFTNWKDGIPGLKTLGGIDPFKVKSVHFAQNTRNMNLKVDLKDVVTKGLSKTKVLNATVNDEYSLRISVKVPSVQSKGEYRMKGTFLLLNLNSTGPIEFEISDVDIIFSIKAKLLAKDNQKFFDVTSVKSKVVNVGNFFQHLGNLISGNAELDETINAVFNQNWRENFVMMRPVLQETVDAILLDRYKKIFAYVPASYFFVDLP